VDSVAGSDSNNGTTTATPFATLAKVNASVVADNTKCRVGLKRGSYWREQLGDIDGGAGSLPSGTTIVDYGTGTLPVLDGADIASNGNFSLAGGQTKTYQISWSHSLPNYSGKEFFTVWENGNRLTRVTSIANCEAAAGSFYAPTPVSGSPAAIYVHASNDSNISTNGKTYEITKRLYCISGASIDGCSVSNVRARRGGSNNGSIELGTNATLFGVIGQEGRLHNILFASGIATDCYSWKLEAGTGGTGWVAFSLDATGLSATWIRCYHIGDTDAASPDGDIGFYAHSSAGAGTQHASISLTDCHSYYCFGAFDGLATSFNLTRGGAENVTFAIASGANSVVADDCYFKMNNLSGGQKVLNPAGTAGSLTNTRIEIASQIRAGFLGSGNWTISNNTIYCSFTSYSYIIDYDEASTINFHHNICVNTHNVLASTLGKTNLTLGTWDNNVYKDDGGGTFWTLNSNPFANGLAAWKTLSGQETNSITSDPLFSGSPSAGDFTLQSGSPAIALAAGATNDPTKGRWALPVWATVVSNLGSW
jgi:hypothetical protein